MPHCIIFNQNKIICILNFIFSCLQLRQLSSIDKRSQMLMIVETFIDSSKISRDFDQCCELNANLFMFSFDKFLMNFFPHVMFSLYNPR